MIKRIKKIYHSLLGKMNKKTLIIYSILRVLVLLCLVREIMRGDYLNAFICLISLVLFLLPVFVEKIFKIDLPDVLEISILFFIFSAEILGEINNFYGTFEYFDLLLHTISGFLCASVGFSLIYLLNKNVKSFKLSPMFVAIVAFSFSMTIGIAWEFLEYGVDKFLDMDMQKDTIINNIYTVELDPTKSNKVIKFEDIDKTILFDKDGNEITTINGYLDIGLLDTMEDLFVNFIGAIIYSFFGFIYIKNEDKNKIAQKFLITKEVK